MQSDGDYVRDFQSGNKKALPQLVKKWHVKFCEKAYWIVKDVHVAKDIAQDSWRIIIDKLQYLNNPDKFGSWAIRIVYNKSIDVLNNKNKERLKLHEFQYEQMCCNEDHLIENQVLKTRLKIVMNTMTDNHQVVLRLFYVEDYSLNQIAELLEISVGTAKSRLFYAREKLKLILKNINYEN